MTLSRRDQILKLIVEHFIKTAVPVGSHTLIEVYELPYSSATIRAEMADLEGDGLLEKTHTSSGRVPSSKGYRYYIDNLRNRRVDEQIKQQLQLILEKKTQSIEEIIKQSCEILAHMTNLASIVLGPNAKEERLVSLSIVPIAGNSATAVFVTDQGYVENKTFVIPETMSMRDLQKSVTLLNERLQGTPVADLVNKMEAIRPILEDYIAEHDVIYQAFAQAFLHFASDRLRTYGQDELFSQPEFTNDAQKLRHLISLLDSPEVFREVQKTGENITIKIGDVNEEYGDVAIVTSRLAIPGRSEGTIAVVGPTRMDYDRVVSALEYIAGMLEEHFKKER
ncbi:MAG: heat-inducible transcriptional repressor HrcA [Bacilli bacterium]|jgi:heat-inducible transcriptional repressor